MTRSDPDATAHGCRFASGAVLVRHGCRYRRHRWDAGSPAVRCWFATDAGSPAVRCWFATDADTGATGGHLP
ncbi:MAG: hypothetical protein ACRCYX_14590 [Dermatophilaceae bacterium]